MGDVGRIHPKIWRCGQTSDGHGAFSQSVIKSRENQTWKVQSSPIALMSGRQGGKVKPLKVKQHLLTHILAH